ncbi:MAG: 50S ribosomal protein L10, partial [Candidatus Aenigmatarchaeota archaeon]
MSEEIPEWKQKEVKMLTNLLETSPVIGVVNIEGIPAYQMQQMRSKLRGTANLRVSKNTFLEKAIERASEKREGLKELEEFIEGQIAIVSTNLNPFKLFNRMEETKTKAPASGGEIAPESVEVEEGETPFKPGPIVGDLQKVGIPASIQGGKVVINTTKTVVKEGETISNDLAAMLRRLDINPITVGLDLKSVYEDGLVYEKDDLDIDPTEFIEGLKTGASSAFALSV